MQALDAGSAAALPDGLRAELEQLEDHGGVRHLLDLAAQIKVGTHPSKNACCCCWSALTRPACTFWTVTN